MNDEIPIIDLNPISLIHVDVASKKYEEIGKLLSQALKTHGFAYLKNHGIPPDIVKNTFKQSRNFFSLPDSQKIKYR